MSDGLEAPVPSRRSGSNTRLRQTMVNIRFSDEELARIRQLSDNSPHSTAALIRNHLLGVPLPRKRRRPQAEELSIARLLGELASLRGEFGKIGSNLNQIAFHLNAGRETPGQADELRAALDDQEAAIATLLELREACLRSLGFESDDDPE